jgi:AraC family transcriptional regulator
MANEHEPHAHTRTVLARCPGEEVTVTDFRCRACRHPLGAEEWNTEPSIVFVRRGLFLRAQEGDTVVADSSHVLFFNPGQPYRISHPIEGGDECTILTISARLAGEIVAQHAPRSAERSAWLPFQRGQSRASLSSWRIHYALLERLHTRTQLLLDEFLLGVVDKLIEDGQSDPAPRRTQIARRARNRTARRHAELAHGAMTTINRDLAQPPGLTALASAMGCSAYHLSRVFREVVGVSLRSYLATARARAAVDALARGACDLTDLALRLGYVDHSHFTNAFNKEWKMSPSAFRATLLRSDH